MKINVYKGVYSPILTFGCESWVLTKRLKSQLQNMEMKYLRRVIGITRLDRVRNVDVRNELETELLIDKIEQGQLWWFGHLIRIKAHMSVKEVWEANTLQRRAKGRPARAWNESVKEILKSRGLDVMRVRKLQKIKRSGKK